MTPCQRDAHRRRHLRDLLLDEARLDSLYREHTSEHGTVIADFGRQRVTQKTMGAAA